MTVLEDSSSTSATLIQRVRGLDPEAWRRLAHLYTPLVYRWARQARLHENDAADLGQEVFRTVFARIGDFRREESGHSFRGWLWSITNNKLKEYFRRCTSRPQAIGGSAADRQLQAFPETPPEDSSAMGTDNIRTVLLHRAMELVRGDFEEKTWQAFWRTTIDNRKTAEVAEELQMTPKAVRQAKYRVLRRLRLEMDGLL